VFGLGLLSCTGCPVLVLFGICMLCVHVHLNSHTKIVELGDLFLKLLGLISAKNWVDLHYNLETQQSLKNTMHMRGRKTQRKQEDGGMR
jgi:hypothetical protein